MKYLRGAFTTLAAVLMAGAIAYATNIPLYTGPIQPANLQAALNDLISKINFDTPGLSQFIPGPIASTATTAEQTLATTSIPAGQILSSGQGLDILCSGITQADSNSKTVHLYFGSGIEYSTAAMSTSGENWYLELIINANATPASNAVFLGRGLTSTTAVAATSGVDVSDPWNAAITVKCTVTQGNASASEVQLEQFLIQQIK
jgi:hypothetical protein